MKKHNFDIAFISLVSANLGINFSQVDVPKSLFSTLKKPSKGYMLEIGFIFFTFVYLYAPNSR
jgi:hypothetical protein